MKYVVTLYYYVIFNDSFISIYKVFNPQVVDYHNIMIICLDVWITLTGK